MVGVPRHRDGDRELCVHPDKAISQRATILAALSEARSTVRNVARCDDTNHNIKALRTLGVDARYESKGVWSIIGRGTPLAGRESTLCLGNSATSSRLLLAALAGGYGRYRIGGNASLCSRTVDWLVDPLRGLGAKIDYLGQPGYLPVGVSGRRLAGGTCALTVTTAQATSAMCIAALSAAAPLTIRRRVLARDHTERLLRWTGIRVDEAGLAITVTPGSPTGFDLRVPGDPSNAAYLAALHLASPHGDRWLQLSGVALNPRRLGFFEAIRRMGATVQFQMVDTSGPEPWGSIQVRGPTAWTGVELDGDELIQSTIDELPMLAALATQAKRPTLIRDAADLRDKDTDRITATVRLLRAFGAEAEPTDDGLSIAPSSPLRPRSPLVLPTDHRIVFAAFVLALLVKGNVELVGADASATSNPGAIAQLAQFADVS